MANPPSESQNRVGKLQRWQIRCVALGSLAAILFLMGLAQSWIALTWAGLILFAACLSGILALGCVTWWLSR
jgi:hypothetical protein